MQNLSVVTDSLSLSFGPFQLFPADRRLTKDGLPVHLGGRAMDILIVLAERPGVVVDKRELVERVWAGLTVDEASLRFHIASLRRTLGEDHAGERYIKNVAGRGYFLASVGKYVPGAEPAGPVVDSPAPLMSAFPRRPSKLVGRDQAIDEISGELRNQRLITIVGPGGIGKTSVAITVAHALRAEFENSICFIDLSATLDPELLPSALASALGITSQTGHYKQNIVHFLKQRPFLLILDCCDHLIDRLASLLGELLFEAPQLHVLTTSRESLRIEDERVFKLTPLQCPPARADLTAAELLTYPAAQLFALRATELDGNFAISDDEAPIVAKICVRLDGIALALELAAGRVAAFGIKGIASLLEDRFRLLWRGPRSAMPRHQTLQAALDWSYELLSDSERILLRRLAVFVGTFNLDAATTVCTASGLDRVEVVEGIASLVAKSLLSTEMVSSQLRYRLLDTTLAYCSEKLRGAGEAARLFQLHAAYFLDVLRQAEGKEELKRPLFFEKCDLNNLRTALDWSLGQDQEPALGVELAARSSSLLLEKLLLVECRDWSEAAVARLDETTIGTRFELDLQLARAVSSMFTLGNCEEVRHAFERALTLAQQLGQPNQEMMVRHGLYLYFLRAGDPRAALAISHDSLSTVLPGRQKEIELMADWMMGVAYHLIGASQLGLQYTASALTTKADEALKSFLGYHHRVIALAGHARSLWLTGFGDRAVKIAKDTIRDAEQLNHGVSLSIALALMSYVFLWMGDWAAADEVIDRLERTTERYSLKPYHAVSVALRGYSCVRRQDPETGLRLLAEGGVVLRATGHQVHDSAFSAIVAEALSMQGRFGESISVIDDALTRVEAAGGAYDTPELLRIKGQVLATMPLGDASAAEKCLRDSLALAREQGALAWELRTATTLARLWSRKADQARRALDLLSPIYNQFTEGHGSDDLVNASRLLDHLRQQATEQMERL